MRRIGVNVMFTAGGLAVGRRRGLVFALYGVQAGLALIFIFVTARALTAIFGARPVFDRAAGGDLAALAYLVRDHRDALAALASTALGLALAYAVASLWLVAGLLGALVGRPFGESAARRFWGYLRLWLLTLLPYVLCAGLAIAGLMMAVLWSQHVVDPGDFVGRLLLGLLPGALLLFLVSCAADYARVEMAFDGSLGAARAFGRGVRLVFTRITPTMHYLTYVAVWAAVTLLYIGLTYDRVFAGLAGAWLLFFVRQALSLVRFLARVGTYAGQVAYVRGTPQSTFPVEAPVSAMPVLESEPRPDV